MKKIVMLFLLPFFYHVAIAQNQEAAEKLVSDGIVYHDKGDYKGAIEKYDQALSLNKDNLVALAEKALTLLTMQKYDEAIVCCRRAIDVHSGDKQLNSVFITYGNALDGAGKPGKAIGIYDEGIAMFPDSYMLHFNKGITLNGMKQLDEAILSFQMAVRLNPKHASSHNALARLLDIKKKRIPAVMAYARMLILEQGSERAQTNLTYMQSVLGGNANKTGKNTISINIDAGSLSDTTSDGKNKENSFSSTDLIIQMTGALDFEDTKKSAVEKLASKFETLCASLSETKKDNFGFYWVYYVPYFVEMKEKKFIETFAYIAMASSDDKKVAKWLKSHKDEVANFYDWSREFKWLK